jgi:poly(3-hydroxybutyrate) depolymerase
VSPRFLRYAANVAIDAKRVIATGLSAGGAMAVESAARTLRNRPEGAPRCSGSKASGQRTLSHRLAADSRCAPAVPAPTVSRCAKGSRATAWRLDDYGDLTVESCILQDENHEASFAQGSAGSGSARKATMDSLSDLKRKHKEAPRQVGSHARVAPMIVMQRDADTTVPPAKTSSGTAAVRPRRSWTRTGRTRRTRFSAF